MLPTLTTIKVDTAGNQLPYINEMDEIFVGESEVRLLKLVNGEVELQSPGAADRLCPAAVGKPGEGRLCYRSET